MSVTATENETVYRTARNVLADYELHYTRAEPAAGDAPVSLQDGQHNSSDTSNPPDWPVDYRRVPPHRPINHNLDPNERYVFLNNGERMFVFVMLFGVRINSVREFFPLPLPADQRD